MNNNNDILFKPNALILATSNQAITSNELKVYDTLLQRCQITQDEHWRKAEVSLLDLQKIIKDKNRNSKESIKKLLELFMSIKIRFSIKNKDYGATLISDYMFNKETGSFTCSMTQEVYATLTNYKEIGYSPLDLKLVRQARGFYTQKIYQLLRMWSRENKRVTKEFTLEQIKNTCDIFEGTSYDMYKAFKNKVLKPAIKEINEKLNMEVTFIEIKVMRKVQKIEFIFTDHEPRKYKFEPTKIIEIKEVKKISEKTEITSTEYVNLIDAKINISVHDKLILDYPNFINIMPHIEKASERTLSALGGKTINKRNYKYFITTLENLLPTL